MIGCDEPRSLARSRQYSDDTANLLAAELLDGATDDDVVAVVSAPSVFVALRNQLVRTLVFGFFFFFLPLRACDIALCPPPSSGKGKGGVAVCSVFVSYG